MQNWKLEKWPKASELVRIKNWSYMLLLKNFQITYSLVQNTHRVVILKHTGKNHLCLCQQNHKTATYFYPGGGSSFTSHPNVNLSLILLEPISPTCKGNNGNLDSMNRLLWKSNENIHGIERYKINSSQLSIPWCLSHQESTYKKVLKSALLPFLEYMLHLSSFRKLRFSFLLELGTCYVSQGLHAYQNYLKQT